MIIHRRPRGFATTEVEVVVVKVNGRERQGLTAILDHRDETDLELAELWAWSADYLKRSRAPTTGEEPWPRS